MDKTLASLVLDIEKWQRTLPQGFLNPKPGTDLGLDRVRTGKSADHKDTTEPQEAR